jgi:hypothetical protein
LRPFPKPAYLWGGFGAHGRHRPSTVTSDTNPALFTSVTVDGAPGQLVHVLAPSGLGIARLTVRATDSDGMYTETKFNAAIGPVLHGTTSANTFCLRLDPGYASLSIWRNVPVSGGRSRALPLASFTTLTIAGDAGDETLTVDLSNGTPDASLHFTAVTCLPFYAREVVRVPVCSLLCWF